MGIDTKTCTHRAQRYNSIAELRADVARLVEAERAGSLVQHGNWTLGQNLNHLAAWVGYAYSGNPLRPPFFIRWMLKGKKQQYLTKGLPRGVKIPRVPNGTLATELVPTPAALDAFSTQWARLEATAPTLPNPIFGPLSHEEWISLHLRHAELHLGYLQPNS